MKNTPLVLFSLIALIVLLAACSQAPIPGDPTLSAQATTLIVSNLSDGDPGSLRDVISNASAGDTITFGLSGTIKLISTLTIAKDLTIDATGQSITLDGQNQVRVLWNQGANLTLTNLTITNGRANVGGYGAGILNSGTLTLNNSTVSGNSTNYRGGGIYNYHQSTLTLNHSTVSGNSANFGGGGIYNDISSTLTLKNSTVSGNWAPNSNGGGIFNDIFSTLTLKNSIIANSTGGDCGKYDNSVTVTDQGYNLIEDTSCGLSNGINGNIVGSDPNLGDLQDNGGPTFTHALSSGSPALDHIPQGTNGCGSDFSTDQRGTHRPQGTACDIGAFELEVITDSTPPVIEAKVEGTLGNNDWYTSDVSVAWRVTDEESPVSSQTGCETQNVTTDTTGVTFTCEATSAGGTASQSVTVKRDTTAPGIAFANRTPANSAGWNNSDVTLNWDCTDATSGVVTASVSQTVSSEGANQSSMGTCSDYAGLSVSDTQTGINIDKTAPTLTPVVTPNPVVLKASASVSSGASDSLSGLASETCALVDTSSVGKKSVSCSATDNAGNSASASASYQVIYTFSGFLSPVDSLPTLNQVKAGAALPVKFSLAGHQGSNILAAGSPSSQTIACGSGLAVDDIEETVTAGSSGLSYDAATDTYSYVWKTNKAWVGTCRQLIVTLIDGTQHLANFKFK